MKTILVDAWNTFVTEEGLNIEMKELLDTFEEQKIILTNANEEQKKKLGIVAMPYAVFTLAHHPDKVDPLYYTTMLKKYGLSTSDVVYFEHSLEAVESARSVGITTHHYNKDTKDLGTLQTFLNDNIVTE